MATLIVMVIVSPSLLVFAEQGDEIREGESTLLMIWVIVICSVVIFVCIALSVRATMGHGTWDL